MKYMFFTWMVCRYDPVLDQYTNLSSLPEPRTRGGADILGGMLYYVGGYTSADEDGMHLTDLHLQFHLASSVIRAAIWPAFLHQLASS